MGEKVARAQRLAPSLVGLTIKQARCRVADEPGLYLKEVAPEDGVMQDRGFGRITVTVVRGQVTAAEAG
jgi:hypothetical protein